MSAKMHENPITKQLTPTLAKDNARQDKPALKVLNRAIY